jgi:hypothetical protein
VFRNPWGQDVLHGLCTKLPVGGACAGEGSHLKVNRFILLSCLQAFPAPPPPRPPVATCTPAKSQRPPRRRSFFPPATPRLEELRAENSLEQASLQLLRPWQPPSLRCPHLASNQTRSRQEACYACMLKTCGPANHMRRYIYIYVYIYGYTYIYICGYQVPDTRSARSCQVPDRARYQIVPGT